MSCEGRQSQSSGFTLVILLFESDANGMTQISTALVPAERPPPVGRGPQSQGGSREASLSRLWLQRAMCRPYGCTNLEEQVFACMKSVFDGVLFTRAFCFISVMWCLECTYVLMYSHCSYCICTACNCPRMNVQCRVQDFSIWFACYFSFKKWTNPSLVHFHQLKCCSQTLKVLDELTFLYWYFTMGNGLHMYLMAYSYLWLLQLLLGFLYLCECDTRFANSVAQTNYNYYYI